MVRLRLPNAVMQWQLQDLPKVVPRPVGLLRPADSLMQFAYEKYSKFPTISGGGGEKFERIVLSPYGRQCILVEPTFAGCHLGGQTFGYQGFRNAPINVIEALDDAGLYRVTPEATPPRLGKFAFGGAADRSLPGSPQGIDRGEYLRKIAIS
jgi:hypothetical protein